MNPAAERKTCQRCLGLMPRGDSNPGALSRISGLTEERYVCSDCGEREAARADAGVDPVTADRWPMTADALATEDRLRHEAAQASAPRIEIDDDDLKDFYAE